MSSTYFESSSVIPSHHHYQQLQQQQQHLQQRCPPYPSQHHVSSSYVHANENASLHQPNISPSPHMMPRFSYSHVVSTPPPPISYASNYSQPYQPAARHNVNLRRPSSFSTYFAPTAAPSSYSNRYENDGHTPRKRK